MRFISVLCYWPSLISPQIICLAALLHKLILKKRREYSFINLFEESSCLEVLLSIERSRIIPLPKLLQFSVIFLPFPMFYAFSKIAMFWKLQYHPECRQPLEYVELLCNLSTTIFFGMFCFFLYLRRVAMERRGDQAVAYIANNTNDMAKCEKETLRFFEEYYQLQKLIFPWYSFIMLTSTLGFTVFLTLNYTEFSEQDSLAPGGNASSFVGHNDTIINLFCDARTLLNATTFFRLYNVLLLSRLSLVAVLPCFVVKGMDLKYIWRRFQKRVSFVYFKNDRRFWTNLTVLIESLTELSTTMDFIVSLVVPFIGIATGVLSGKQL